MPNQVREIAGRRGRLFNGNGVKFSVEEREALESGVKPPLSRPMIDRGMGKRRQAKALQRLPPILMSKPNAIGFLMGGGSE
jgi:hypothetical protein